MIPDLVRSYGPKVLGLKNDNRDAEITEKDDSRLRCCLFCLFRLFIPKPKNTPAPPRLLLHILLKIFVPKICDIFNKKFVPLQN